MTVQAIVQWLSQLNDIHLQLLELGERKKQVLIDNHVNELTHLTNQEANLMKQVAELEERWLAEIANFLEAKGYTPDPSMTMSDFTKLIFNEDDKEALTAAQHQLLATVEQLKELNALNQQLIEQSLSFIDYTLDLMTEDPADTITYENPTKQGKSGSGKGIFDTKA